MRFEITFDENIYREQSKKYFALIWEDFQLKNKKRLYVIIPFILLGSLMIYGKGNLGYLFLAISVFTLFQYYKLYKHHKINKGKYLTKVEEKIVEHLSHNQLSIWEFSEDKFYYSDFNFELKINWNSFFGFKILENNLFLELKETIYATFFLNKDEVGEDEFNKIILFLESKIAKLN